MRQLESYTEIVIGSPCDYRKHKQPHPDDPRVIVTWIPYWSQRYPLRVVWVPEIMERVDCERIESSPPVLNGEPVQCPSCGHRAIVAEYTWSVLGSARVVYRHWAPQE